MNAYSACSHNPTVATVLSTVMLQRGLGNGSAILSLGPLLGHCRTVSRLETGGQQMTHPRVSGCILYGLVPSLPRNVESLM